MVAGQRLLDVCPPPNLHSLGWRSCRLPSRAARSRLTSAGSAGHCIQHAVPARQSSAGPARHVIRAHCAEVRSSLPKTPPSAPRGSPPFGPAAVVETTNSTRANRVLWAPAESRQARPALAVGRAPLPEPAPAPSQSTPIATSTRLVRDHSALADPLAAGDPGSGTDGPPTVGARRTPSGSRPGSC